MKPEDRYRWILRRIDEEPSKTVDILNRDFVDDYVEATGAKVLHRAYGANTCSQLGRDLLAMKRDYMVNRKRTGIDGMGGMGFPKWVWSYSVRPGPVFDTIMERGKPPVDSGPGI